MDMKILRDGRGVNAKYSSVIRRYCRLKNLGREIDPVEFYLDKLKCYPVTRIIDIYDKSPNDSLLYLSTNNILKYLYVVRSYSLKHVLRTIDKVRVKWDLPKLDPEVITGEYINELSWDIEETELDH